MPKQIKTPKNQSPAAKEAWRLSSQSYEMDKTKDEILARVKKKKQAKARTARSGSIAETKWYGI